VYLTKYSFLVLLFALSSTSINIIFSPSFKFILYVNLIPSETDTSELFIFKYLTPDRLSVITPSKLKDWFEVSVGIFKFITGGVKSHMTFNSFSVLFPSLSVEIILILFSPSIKSISYVNIPSSDTLTFFSFIVRLIIPLSLS